MNYATLIAMQNQGIVSDIKAFYRLARQGTATVLQRCRNLGETNYRMGLQFLNEGKPANAAFRFRMAGLLDKTHADAWFQLGLCQLGAGRKARAEASFRRALSVNPEHAESRYLLELTAPGALPQAGKPKTFPETIIIRHFTALAGNYDDMRAQEKYCGHILSIEALQRHKPKASETCHVLDVGCGTGIAAPLLKPLCGRLTGIDLTPAMAEAARLRAQYDRVLTGDAVRHLSAQASPVYDAAMLADVLGYIGALDALFAGAAKALHPGGLLVFTADIGEAADFGLSGRLERFTHSENYLRAQAKAAKLDMLELTPKDIGTEQFSLLGVCRKAG